MNSKICSKCKNNLPFARFWKGNGSHGLRYECKSCFKVNPPEKQREYEKIWRKRNPRYYSEYVKKRAAVDIEYKVGRNMRSLVYNKLHRKGIDKNQRVFETLPYTIIDLMSHLESQFKEGMTWDNYGKWHIDHIKPDIAFGYTSMHDEDFSKSWALSNLQPLWAKENSSKATADKLYRDGAKCCDLSLIQTNAN